MMKKINFYFLISIQFIPLLISCHKDSKPEFYWGEATALKNGSAWIAKPRAGTNDQMAVEKEIDIVSILMSVYDSEGIQKESLSLEKFSLEKGYNKIYPWFIADTSFLTGGFYATCFDDAVRNTYKICEDKENYLTVNSYDENSKIIEGTFQLTFIIELPRSKDEPDAPDTIRFTNGKFKTKIFERN
jgi:hypothetical protein